MRNCDDMPPVNEDDGMRKTTALEDRGIYMFTGDVDDEQCDSIIRWILEENFENRHPMLTLIINSPGGYVSSGFAVVDAIVGSQIPIRTLGLGVIASMGLLMFIAGHKGERILTPNTLIMSHQWLGGTEGKEHELIAGIKRDSLISDMITRHYKKHTGLPINKVRKYLLPPSDVYLTAVEAKELGLCDQIRLFN
jgi:ATP-dependent Clp protease protease subunit